MIQYDVLDKGFVRRIDTPNSDLKVVNAARVSFHKESSYENEQLKLLKESDKKLIHFLAKNNHWTPFAHCRYSFIFDSERASNYDAIRFLIEIQNQGFEVDAQFSTGINENLQYTISGSLYGFIRNIRSPWFYRFFGKSGIYDIFAAINKDCPESCSALMGGQGYADFLEESSKRTTESYYDSGITLIPQNDFSNQAHSSLTLLIKAPIFVRTQLFKHKIGFVENEVSRRYVNEEPLFYDIHEWRSKPEKNIKQGSGEILFQGSIPEYDDLIKNSINCYKKLDKIGVAPEQARATLLQSMYTEWYWTANLSSLKRMIGLRTDQHAQQETRLYAEAISKILEQSKLDLETSLNNHHNDYEEIKTGTAK